MQIPPEIENQFFLGLPSEKTTFGINAPVSILRGLHRGKAGTVISILAIEPQTKYLVELSSGADVEMAESDLVATL
ncbi:MAG: hypothetical protein ACXVC0_21455 [Bdellovibrionota bacterium]